MSDKLETFTIFASFILAALYEQFPIPSELDRQAALRTAFDFQQLTDVESELRTRENVRELLTIATDKSPLSSSERAEINAALSRKSSLEREKELKRKVSEEKNKINEMEKIFEGTMGFLKAEGYIRQLAEKWQLTEKGFAHLNKRFALTEIVDAKETLWAKIKEQIANPSKPGLQILMQIFGWGLSNVPGA